MSRVGRPPKEPHEFSVPDLISLGVLTSLCPPSLIDEVLRDTGRLEQRSRLLPSRVVVYYVLAMTLYSSAGYREVFRLLVEGLRALDRSLAISIPQKSAISKARERVGSEPLRALFERIARPMALPATQGAWYRDWRLMSMDGSTIEVADTAKNDAFFGRPGASRGEKSAYPRLRWMGLGENGTRAVVAMAVGPYRRSEIALATQLVGSLSSGMLCLGDRNFYGFDLWEAFRKSRADLLWRIKKKNPILPVEKRFDDGSYLTRIYPSERVRRRDHPGVHARVVNYAIDDEGRPQSEPVYRLLTTILDPKCAPAAELAALYAERWQVEVTIGEVKTHQRGSNVVLRSKKPDGVLQEMYGYLLVHYAVRWLMHEAALEADIDPDRLSFLHSLRVVRRKLSRPESFSPHGKSGLAPGGDDGDSIGT